MFKYSILVCASDSGNVYGYMGYIRKKYIVSHITVTESKENFNIFPELHPTVLIAIRHCKVMCKLSWNVSENSPLLSFRQCNYASRFQVSTLKEIGKRSGILTLRVFK